MPEEATGFITAQVRQIISEQEPPLVGYSNFAKGADQLVAQEVLDAGGHLHAVIPCRNYDTTFPDEASRDTYRRLLAVSSWKEQLGFAEPSERAYDAAGKWVAEHCEVMIAIWDGKPARGLGGTADAVAHARALGRRIHIVWPEGVERD